MARSQLLKDIVNGKESLENILLRLKVILSDLENEDIMNWVNGELEGYAENKDTLPSYRILKGSPIGTYFINHQTQYTNQPVPLKQLISDEELYDNIITLKLTNSIRAIQNILNSDSRDNFAKIIETGLCHAISTEELQIALMRIKFGSNQLDDVVSKVKSKLIEIVLELEKHFNNLDELDIEEQLGEENTNRDNIVYNIQNIIYDSSLKLGDSNKITRSKLGNLFGGNR